MASSSSGFGPTVPTWEQRDYAQEGGDEGAPSEDEGRIDQMTATDCSAAFLQMLIQLKIAGALSAKQACLLSFCAKGGGLCDPGASLALPPN